MYLVYFVYHSCIPAWLIIDLSPKPRPQKGHTDSIGRCSLAYVSFSVLRLLFMAIEYAPATPTTSTNTRYGSIQESTGPPMSVSAFLDRRNTAYIHAGESRLGPEERRSQKHKAAIFLKDVRQRLPGLAGTRLISRASRARVMCVLYVHRRTANEVWKFPTVQRRRNPRSTFPTSGTP